MGMFKKTCSTGYTPSAPAPNPDPSRWQLLHAYAYPHGYVLIVRYLDATNFEGVKVMVYRGKQKGVTLRLDPHFSEADDSPIARFRPDEEGIEMAKKLAASLPPGRGL